MTSTLKIVGLGLTIGICAFLSLQMFQTAAMAAESGSVSSDGAGHTKGSGAHAGIVAFLQSSKGGQILRASHHPMAVALSNRLGVERSEVMPAPRLVQIDSTRSIQATASIDCGAATGTRFNREPRTPPDALPQDSPSVDFLFGSGLQGGDLVVGAANDFRGFFGGLGDSATGYYVHRNGSDSNLCTPQFEGGLPPITDTITGESLLAGGDPVVEADPPRNAFYVADIRLGSSAAAIALFRATSANLNSAISCPNGTHTSTQAQVCWPTSIEVNAKQDGSMDLVPDIAVDVRAIGTGKGAGDVYVSGTVVTPLAGNQIFLAACKNDLSSCSPGKIVSGSDFNTDESHVRLRPDINTKLNGSITLTYVNISEGPPPDFSPIYEIKYVTCTPVGAPIGPTCSPATVITTEIQPISFRGGGLGNGSLAATGFPFATYPKHDHRVDQNGVETYVVWDRCKVKLIAGGGICPDADIAMAASVNNGQSWIFGTVDAGAGDQYFPWIVTDVFTNVVNVAYYSTIGDKMNHQAKIVLAQIRPGSATPDAVSVFRTLTTIGMEPSGDFLLRDSFIGNKIGVSARGTSVGSRAYVHYMHNAVNGNYNGSLSPEQNNHLSEFNY